MPSVGCGDPLLSIKPLSKSISNSCPTLRFPLKGRIASVTFDVLAYMPQDFEPVVLMLPLDPPALSDDEPMKCPPKEPPAACSVQPPPHPLPPLEPFPHPPLYAASE